MHLDTGVILELFSRPRHDPLVQRILDAVRNEALTWSVVQFGELADACRRTGASIDQNEARVRAMVEVVPVETNVAIAASALKGEARRHRDTRDFSLLDGVVLATARSKGQRLLTTDPDFLHFDDAIVLTLA